MHGVIKTPIYFIILMLLIGCYDPEPFVPDFLTAEATVVHNNVTWHTSDAKATVNFINERITFSATNPDGNKAVGAFVSAHEGSFFNTYLDRSYYMGVKSIEYRTNDTLWVNMSYVETKDGRPFSNEERDNVNQWDDWVPEGNFFKIDTAFEYAEQVYLSGSFEGFVFRSYDNSLNPAFQSFHGTFRNVRATVYP